MFFINYKAKRFIFPGASVKIITMDNWLDGEAIITRNTLITSRWEYNKEGYILCRYQKIYNRASRRKLDRQIAVWDGLIDYNDSEGVRIYATYFYFTDKTRNAATYHIVDDRSSYYECPHGHGCGRGPTIDLMDGLFEEWDWGRKRKC